MNFGLATALTCTMRAIRNCLLLDSAKLEASTHERVSTTTIPTGGDREPHEAMLTPLPWAEQISSSPIVLVLSTLGHIHAPATMCSPVR